MFPVKRQQQRAERVQPTGSALGVGGGADAAAEAGGEGLLCSAAAAVQLPAPVRTNGLSQHKHGKLKQL